MTLAELQATIGAPRVHPGATYSATKRGGELLLTAWEDILDGARGWWWALSRGDRQVVVSTAFIAGSREVMYRVVDIAVQLAPVEPIQGEVAS